MTTNEGIFRSRRTRVAVALLAGGLMVLPACSDKASKPEADSKTEQSQHNREMLLKDAPKQERQKAEEAAQFALHKFGDKFVSKKIAAVGLGVCDSYVATDAQGTERVYVTVHPGFESDNQPLSQAPGTQIDITFGTALKGLNSKGEPTGLEITNGGFSYTTESGEHITNTLKSHSMPSHPDLGFSDPSIKGEIEILPAIFQGEDGQWSYLGYLPGKNPGEKGTIWPVLKTTSFVGEYSPENVRAACDRMLEGFPLDPDQFRGGVDTGKVTS